MPLKQRGTVGVYPAILSGYQAFTNNGRAAEAVRFQMNETDQILNPDNHLMRRAGTVQEVASIQPLLLFFSFFPRVIEVENNLDRA